MGTVIDHDEDPKDLEDKKLIKFIEGIFAAGALFVATPIVLLLIVGGGIDLSNRASDLANAAAWAVFALVPLFFLFVLRLCGRPAFRFLKDLMNFKNVFLLLISLALFSCTKVPPGYVGIKVNQWGSQKGVEDFPIHTGTVLYNIFTTDVYQFPTFRQNLVWTQAKTDGSPGDDSVTFNSVEGSVINGDLSLSYSLVPDKVPLVFVTFRKDMDHITNLYIKSEVRDALGRCASTLKVIDIFGAKKTELLDAAKADLNGRLNKIGFEFEMVSFVGKLRGDDNVMRSINATIEATQLAISAQNKVVQAKAEADQAIETSRGQAASILAVANAQAEANKAVSASLTPELVSWKALERWNGNMPQFVGGGTMPMIQVPGIK